MILNISKRTFVHGYEFSDIEHECYATLLKCIKIYDLDKEVLIIYDIVGLWYYVKTTHPEKEKCYGWLKLHKTHTYLLNAEFYK